MTSGGDGSAWARASVREAEGEEEGLGNGMHASEPVACVLRDGTTPDHLEPGRETSERRGYWREARWESRSVRHPEQSRAAARRPLGGRARGHDAAWSSGSSSGS